MIQYYPIYDDKNNACFNFRYLKHISLYIFNSLNIGKQIVHAKTIFSVQYIQSQFSTLFISNQIS